MTRPVRAVTTNKRSSSHSEHMIAVLVVEGRLAHINHKFVRGNVVNNQDWCSVGKPLIVTVCGCSFNAEKMTPDSQMLPLP